MDCPRFICRTRVAQCILSCMARCGCLVAPASHPLSQTAPRHVSVSALESHVDIARMAGSQSGVGGRSPRHFRQCQFELMAQLGDASLVATAGRPVLRERELPSTPPPFPAPRLYVQLRSPSSSPRFNDPGSKGSGRRGLGLRRSELRGPT